MLRQCWSSSPTERPAAAAIVEFLASDPELITPCLDVPASSIDHTLETLDVKALDRAGGHSFPVRQTRKSAPCIDQNQAGCFDAAQIVQAGLETVQCIKQSGYKHPSQKSLHESFRKTKRDLRKDKIPDNLSQITYL